MKLACVMVSPSGEKRRIDAPPVMVPVQFQRIAVVTVLAAHFLTRDLAAVNTSAALIPRSVTDDIRAELLSDALKWDFDPVPYLQHPMPGREDWFDVAGDVSATVPGLFYLYQAASNLSAGFSWSPGQVSDILQAMLHTRPILYQHGLDQSPKAEAAIETFQAFLALAHSNDGHILSNA